MSSTYINDYSECSGNRHLVVCKLDQPGVGETGKNARFWGTWFEDSMHQCESRSNEKKVGKYKISLFMTISILYFC
jgi:hypothetical protein